MLKKIIFYKDAVRLNKFELHLREFCVRIKLFGHNTRAFTVKQFWNNAKMAFAGFILLFYCRFYWHHFIDLFINLIFKNRPFTKKLYEQHFCKIYVVHKLAYQRNQKVWRFSPESLLWKSWWESMLNKIQKYHMNCC